LRRPYGTQKPGLAWEREARPWKCCWQTLKCSAGSLAKVDADAGSAADAHETANTWFSIASANANATTNTNATGEDDAAAGGAAAAVAAGATANATSNATARANAEADATANADTHLVEHGRRVTQGNLSQLSKQKWGG